MSLYKWIWIDRDTTYAGSRREQMADVWREIDEFKFRVARRRYHQEKGRKCLDRLWPISLNRAVRTLGIDTRSVNDGILFRTQTDCDNARTLAEKIWYGLSGEQRP